MRGSDRRAVLDMVVIAGPASLFACIVPALIIADMIPPTPALVAAIMSCVVVAIPYTTNGVRAARRLIQ